MRERERERRDIMIGQDIERGFLNRNEKVFEEVPHRINDERVGPFSISTWFYSMSLYHLSISLINFF